MYVIGYRPKNHAQTVKRILRYLKGTVDFGLWYPRGARFDFISYSNVDWEGCVDGKKSNNECEFLLGNCMVSCVTRKYNSISLSTTEVEYIAATECCIHIIWMKRLFKIYRYPMKHQYPSSVITPVPLTFQNIMSYTTELTTFLSSIIFQENKLQIRLSSWIM